MIIVYGGAFNPPTLAHQKIANILIRKYKPKKFIFLPVGDYYTWKDNLISFYHRKNMLELVFNDDIFEINDLENEKEYKGTYWALNKIKEAYKSDVYFVVGADNLEQIEKWINYEKLLKEFKFIIITRKGYDYKKIIKEKYLKYKHNFEIVKINVNISSSQFRVNTNNKSIINELIYTYIKKNNLYGVDDVKI